MPIGSSAAMPAWLSADAWQRIALPCASDDTFRHHRHHMASPRPLERATGAAMRASRPRGHEAGSALVRPTRGFAGPWQRIANVGGLLPIVQLRSVPLCGNWFPAWEPPCPAHCQHRMHGERAQQGPDEAGKTGGVGSAGRGGGALLQKRDKARRRYGTGNGTGQRPDFPIARARLSRPVCPVDRDTAAIKRDIRAGLRSRSQRCQVAAQLPFGRLCLLP